MKQPKAQRDIGDSVETVMISTLLKVTRGSLKGRIVVLDGYDEHTNEYVAFVGGLMDIMWGFRKSSLAIATNEDVDARKRVLRQKFIDIAQGKPTRASHETLALDALELMMLYDGWIIHDRNGGGEI